MDVIPDGAKHGTSHSLHDSRRARNRRRQRRTAIVAAAGAVAMLMAGVTIPAMAAQSPSGKTCPRSGRIAYTLQRAASPTPEQSDAYARITTAMDEAVSWYNCYADLVKQVNVSYEPGVPTAEGNSNGNLRFGSIGSMQKITAMHELSHTIGIGTTTAWTSLVQDGRYTGAKGLAKYREITGQPADIINADQKHFWPNGLNQVSEVKTEDDLIHHVQIVEAMAKDMFP